MRLAHKTLTGFRVARLQFLKIFEILLRERGNREKFNSVGNQGLSSGLPRDQAIDWRFPDPTVTASTCRGPAAGSSENSIARVAPSQDAGSQLSQRQQWYDVSHSPRSTRPDLPIPLTTNLLRCSPRDGARQRPAHPRPPPPPSPEGARRSLPESTRSRRGRSPRSARHGACSPSHWTAKRMASYPSATCAAH